MSSHRTKTTTDWDEIDFEFLGNVTRQPWILQTNVYVNGKANREHRIYLWFDPTTTFHTYSIVWTPQQIMYVSPLQTFNYHLNHMNKDTICLYILA